METAQLRPLRIRISDPSLREELSVHYARSGFDVHPVGDRELDVARTDAPDGEQARREIETHLLVWELLRPDAPAEIVDDR
jgi:hypothetical protein